MGRFFRRRAAGYLLTSLFRFFWPLEALRVPVETGEDCDLFSAPGGKSLVPVMWTDLPRKFAVHRTGTCATGNAT
jgi:hypothetical protein